MFSSSVVGHTERFIDRAICREWGTIPLVVVLSFSASNPGLSHQKQILNVKNNK